MFNNPAAFRAAKIPQSKTLGLPNRRICQRPNHIGKFPYRSTEKTAFVSLFSEGLLPNPQEDSVEAYTD
jgi:hypothetical protein